MKRWTEQEIAILKSNINKNPYNLQVAFEKTALEIDRTSSAIKQYYYHRIKPNSRVNKLFMIIGGNSYKKNTKIIHRKNGVLNLKVTHRNNNFLSKVLSFISTIK